MFSKLETALAASEAFRPSHGFLDREAAIWSAEMKHPHESGPGPAIPVLSISPCMDDHKALRQILTPPRFELAFARGMKDAEGLIESGRFPIMIAECNLGQCCWKDVWNTVQRHPQQPMPRVIVSASLPDARLWAEVINLGACSVLTKPFEADEVLWVTTDAWHDWNRDLMVWGKTGSVAARAAV